jgi:hypothetical protein
MKAEDRRMSTPSLYLISDAVSDSIGIFHCLWEEAGMEEHSLTCLLRVVE